MSWSVTQRMGSAPQVVGMVMPVNPFQHINRHAKESSRFPLVHASLHEPRCRRVAKRVRADATSDTGMSDTPGYRVPLLVERSV